MAELPSGWGLTTEKRADGKLDIMGKTDAGETYRVRTTDGPEIADIDVQELRDADREAYSSRATAAQEYLGKITAHSERAKKEREDHFGEQLAEDADRLVRECTEGGMDTRATLIAMPAKFGSTAVIRRNWPKDWN